jgi:hypothetical protein
MNDLIVFKQFICVYNNDCYPIKNINTIAYLYIQNGRHRIKEMKRTHTENYFYYYTL